MSDVGQLGFPPQVAGDEDEDEDDDDDDYTQFMRSPI